MVLFISLAGSAAKRTHQRRQARTCWDRAYSGTYHCTCHCTSGTYIGTPDCTCRVTSTRHPKAKHRPDPGTRRRRRRSSAQCLFVKLLESMRVVAEVFESELDAFSRRFGSFWLLLLLLLLLT